MYDSLHCITQPPWESMPCGSGEGLWPDSSGYIVGGAAGVWSEGWSLRAIWPLCAQSESCVQVLGSKWDLFPAGAGLHQGCALSPILFMIFMDRISRHSRVREELQLGGLRSSSLLFVDDVVLMASLVCDLQLWLDQFSAECEAAELRISTSKSEAMVLCRKPGDCRLRVGNESLTQVNEFKYLVHKWGYYAAGHWLLCCTVVTKKRAWQKKLLIYQSVFVPWTR